MARYAGDFFEIQRQRTTKNTETLAIVSTHALESILFEPLKSFL
jgi:hypothetical protein